jgi:hypothetical protein
MYDIIEAAEGLDESALPSESYVPGSGGEHMPVPTQGYRAGGNEPVFDADSK